MFSLDCFTQTLPDSQADLLWDNVQFLHDSEYETESEINDSPQVFLLSGWGEPGSVVSDEEDGVDNPDGRRYWTCWCAAHRPPYKPGEGNTENKLRPKNLIVLEFELERDIYNPLYPPFSHEVMSAASTESNRSSQSPGVGSGSSTTTSFSRGSGSTTEMGATPYNGLSAETYVDGTPDTTSEPGGSNGHILKAVVNPAEVFLMEKQGLKGDDSWFPSTEDVFESTTSHSKPLKALERMRRINRTFGGLSQSERRSGSRGESPMTGRQRARARRGAHQGIGTMDIFAVLAQINEQLSSAPDLESFLKVVVGVIKDLTQFHRVLVYQFDDAWNGQVVAELVDWRQTHDLYKGLHFPASDIPAQVRDARRNDVPPTDAFTGSRIVQN